MRQGGHKMRNFTECSEKLLKKDQFVCHSCGKILCGKHSYSYVDGNNGAISRNSPILCEDCYIKRYGNS
jgi:uncharacterized UBP type Zn finger protein